MKGIQFMPLMVTAIMEGRKKMTRRQHNGQPCKYKVGEVLYVKEAYWDWGYWQKNGTSKTGKAAWRFVRFVEAQNPILFSKPEVTTPAGRTHCGYYKRSSIFMPAAAARTFLKVTDIRLERLQDITANDAVAEGIKFLNMDVKKYGWRYKDYSPGGTSACLPVASFKTLWQSINGNWNDNPEVWVITFEKTYPIGTTIKTGIMYLTKRPHGWVDAGCNLVIVDESEIGTKYELL